MTIKDRAIQETVARFRWIRCCQVPGATNLRASKKKKILGQLSRIVVSILSNLQRLTVAGASKNRWVYLVRRHHAARGRGRGRGGGSRARL